MDKLVYILCAATSLCCAFVLLKSYARNGLRLLLWSGICFTCLAVTNVLLFVDFVILPAVDLALLRNSITLVGILVLLYGLIWEAA